MEVKEQIIIVEYVLSLLTINILSKEPSQFPLPHLAPREILAKNSLKVFITIDPTGVYFKTGSLAGKPFVFGRKTQVIAYYIQEVLRVGAV